MKRILALAVVAFVAITVTTSLFVTRRTHRDAATVHLAPQGESISSEQVALARNPVVRPRHPSRSRTARPHHAIASRSQKLIRRLPVVRQASKRTASVAVTTVSSSASHRPAIRRMPATGGMGWAHSRAAYLVSNCESGDRSAPDVGSRYNGNASLRDRAYSGKWQMDADFWATYGGLAYANNAADASESAQDGVAYRGFLARGWQPWECASIMGVI